VDQARHARALGGLHRQDRAVDVDAAHLARILHAQGVDAGDVEGQRAAVHAARERLGVQSVAAHRPRAALLHRGDGGVGAGERQHLVAALDQARDERAADHAGAPRDEDAAHDDERSAAEKRRR
jgi:hypothetical protein